MRPQVDIIVPCYNYGRYLRTCIDSLLSQEGVEVRVLILDDHSTDNSPEIGLALARNDARVTFRRHVRNHGHIATYNEGLAWVEAPYLLLISADDLLVAGALARATRVLEAHPDVTMVHGRQVAFSGELVLPEDVSAAGVTILSGTSFIERLCRAGDNPVATPTVVARSAIQRLVGGYEPSLPHTADLEMWLRFAAHGAIAQLQAYQACKRGHERNMQHEYVHRAAGDLRERLAAFQMFLARLDGVVGSRGELTAVVRKALAESAFWRGTELFERGAVDDAAALYALAAEIDPLLPRSSAWRRMRIKHALGPRLWRRLTRSATLMTKRRTAAGAPAN